MFLVLMVRLVGGQTRGLFRWGTFQHVIYDQHRLVHRPLLLVFLAPVILVEGVKYNSAVNGVTNLNVQ